MNPCIASIPMPGASSVSMTFARYGDIEVKAPPLLAIIPVNGAIVVFGYCLAVPANRAGMQAYPPAQLKTLRDVLALVVFVGDSAFHPKQAMRWQVLPGLDRVATGEARVFVAPGRPSPFDPSAAHAVPAAGQEQRVP